MKARDDPCRPHRVSLHEEMLARDCCANDTLPIILEVDGIRVLKKQITRKLLEQLDRPEAKSFANESIVDELRTVRGRNVAWKHYHSLHSQSK